MHQVWHFCYAKPLWKVYYHILNSFVVYFELEFGLIVHKNSQGNLAQYNNLTNHRKQNKCYSYYKTFQFSIFGLKVVLY